ncbi:phage tail assembly protein [Burkholderia multivorans]|uniref:phage tail assembly protein n=1 Tax=Burkholderia multivorans TaxID=87883 RepID=UPI00158FD249|nr:phage tail assembly protein [Burkholderia multivorans]MBU9662197.1 phage tail assembly protein [Burkholderia multivorans]
METVKIKLKYPVSFDGVLRDEIVMRRPKVRDMRAASKQAQGDDELREIVLFATLADVAPDELEGMDMVDYDAMQRAYESFRSVRPASNRNGEGAGSPADEGVRGAAAVG